MNKKNASKELFESFLRLVNKYNALGKLPMQFGTGHKFYHSERHMLDIVGDDPGLNITEFARTAGVTKGAISQVVAKLERKGAVERFKSGLNDKEIRLRLTRLGEQIYTHHQQVNATSINLLWRELKKQSDNEIQCVLRIFGWLEMHLDESRKKRRSHP